MGVAEVRKAGPVAVGEKGHFAQDALNRGNLYGFVSFSGHGSTHNSWASVWSPKEDREGLFDSMLARRTYAGSDEIIVKATADGHMVGEQFAAAVGQAPRIVAQIDAPDNPASGRGEERKVHFLITTSGCSRRTRKTRAALRTWHGAAPGL